MNRTENSIQINGGPGSGNHNPGQGRGIGKPSKKISYEEYVKKFKKSTKTERKELDKKYPEYADKYFDELMGRHLKTLKIEREQKELEEKFKNYENDNSHPHFDLDNMVHEYKDALDITPDEYNGAWNDETKSFEKLKNLKEYYNKVKGIQVKIISMNPADYSHTIIDNDGEHYASMSSVIDRTSKEGIDMYKEKFNNGERVEIPYIKFDENGKFSGEQEGFHRTLAANEIGDSEVPVAIVTEYYGKQPKLNYGRDITQKVEEYFANKKENNSRINRLVNLENRINNIKNSENVKLNKTSGNPYHDSEGKFTFSPSGVGKQTRGFSSPTAIYTGDDIKLKKDGVTLEGTLQYKDGKFYLLIDKEKGSLIEISKDDIRKSIVSKSAKEKQKELLESQGIRHKSPKERRTQEQKHLISELDKMGLFKDKELGTWCMKYADEETLADIYTTLREAESFGLDISSIQLGKIRSGQTWGRAYYRTDGNFKLALSGQIYDRNPIQEMKIKECREGFHTDNSIKAVVRHETGHIISYQNAQRSFNTKDKPKNIWQQEDKIDSYCGKVVSEAMGYSYFTYRETLKDLKKCSNSEISEYGRTNFKEAIAESWSNPNYSLFTKKVSDILKKDLKKPRENSIMNERTEEIPICSGYGPEFEDFEYETSTGKVKTNSRIMRLCSLEKVINSQTENLDYRYDVKAYKEYLKEWLKHKDEKEYLRNNLSAKSYFRSQRLSAILNKVNRGNPYHDKFGRFSSGSSSSSYYYHSDTTLGDKTKSGDITKEIKSFRDFKDKLSEVIETYNSYDIKGQEVWIHPASKLFKNIYSPVTDENTLKLRKDEIEKENKSPFVLVSTYNDEDVIIDGNHVAAAYKELSEEGKNYLVPILYVKKEEIERFEKEHKDYHYKEKTYTKTKLIDE